MVLALRSAPLRPLLLDYVEAHHIDGSFAEAVTLATLFVAVFCLLARIIADALIAFVTDREVGTEGHCSYGRTTFFVISSFSEDIVDLYSQLDFLYPSN